MQKYQLIRPRFLLDEKQGVLNFNGRQFFQNDGDGRQFFQNDGRFFSLGDLRAMQMKYRLLGPLLLLLATLTFGYGLVKLAVYLLGLFDRELVDQPFWLILVALMAVQYSVHMQAFSYLQLQFTDRSFQVLNYSGLLDQLQLQPERRRRRLLTITGWLLLSLALVVGRWPHWQAPDENFPVCIQGKSGPQLQRVGALGPEAQLCEPPLSAPLNSDYNSFHLTDAGDYWLLTIKPLLGEPLEYHYWVSNGTVQPLQWRKNESQAALALLSFIAAAPLTALVYLLWRGLLVHRRIKERFAGSGQ